MTTRNRKSVGRLKPGWVVVVNDYRGDLVAVDRETSDALGEIVKMTFADGHVVRRTPGVKVHTAGRVKKQRRRSEA